MPRATQYHRQQRLIWWLFCLLTLLRLLYAYWYPLDLSGDEAYYWDWGRQPDWGYFSKPPLIAWIMGGLHLSGLDSPFGIRACATLLSSLGLLLLFHLGRAIVGIRGALWATLLLALAPAGAALGLILTIDVPLLLCWTGALLAFHHWVNNPGRNMHWGLAIVLFLGLGLLAKQSMLAFFPLALLYLAGNPATRPRLYRPGTWLGAMAALAFLLPTLIWNQQHAWVTLGHTAHHFTPTQLTLAQAGRNLGELFAAHAGILGPVTWGLVVAAVLHCAVCFRQLDQDQRFLFIFGGFPLLLIVLLGVFQKIQPNWPAPLFITAVLQTVAWLHQGIGPRTRSRWLRAALISAMACSALAYASPLLPLQQGIGGREIDFLRRLRGWEEGALRIQDLRLPLTDGRDHWLLVYGHRFFVSELAFYLPDRPRVYRWPWVPERTESQYELWGLPPLGVAGDALIISADDKRVPGLPASLRRAFVRIEPLGGLDQVIGSGRERHYRLYRGVGWRGFNPAPRQSGPG